MNYNVKLLFGLLVLVLGLVGCKPDFPDYSTGDSFLIPDSISLVVGNDATAAIYGVDSCFYQLVDGEDVVELNARYTVDDKYFYGGIASFIMIHPTAVGEAHVRLFNKDLEFDTTVPISVSEKLTPNDTIFTDYVFYPGDTRFPISLGSARLTVTGPKIMGKRIMDKFILSSTGDESQNNNGECTSWIDVHFNYVGIAYVKFYNEDLDSLIRVEVLPQYRTFEEPELDFDDTRDSVVFKLGNPQSENLSENYLVYNCQGERYPYTLQVNLKSNGVIKDYEVAFVDDDAKTELKLFVEERYKKMNTWNGYYIYARAFDTTYPNIYDADTKVLVENFLHGKICYKNPNDYFNW